jgi:fatty-acyl-CoA synthase
VAAQRRDIRGLADIEAIEREMPLEQRIGARSTYDILAAAAAAHGERVAVHFLREGHAAESPVSLTYAQLFARVNQTANLFHSLGIRPGKAVSYLLPNLPQAHFVIWGGEAAGIVNAINPLLNPAQIAEIIEAADSRVLVALGPVPGSDIWQKVAEVRRLAPKIETVLAVMGPADPANGVLSFEEELARQPGDRLVSGRRIAPDEICSYFHTGGTTGSPKLAQHTHWGEVYEAWVISYLARFSSADTLLLGLPLFHVNAVVVTGLAPFLAGATTVILSPAGYRNPIVIRDFWEIVARYRATFFSAVPTVYAALLNVPMDGADVSSLRYAICGAAPMPVELFRAFERQTGVKILEGYGLTEGTCASCLNPPEGERRIGSIGVRFPYQPMKTVRLDADGRYERDCATDEIGVVTIAGPNVFPGYRQDKFNKSAFCAPGWLNTGDLARRDADGYFWLTGRAKDLIIRGGHNIDPGQIEEVLHQHPAVALAAAVGKPDTYAGEIPVAYVELKPGAAAMADELREFAKARVPERPAAPAEIFVIPRMPVTAVGKIFKPSLRHDITRRVLEAALEPLAEEDVAFAVEVGPHDTHGTLATITVKGAPDGQREAIRAEVETALGAFAVRWQLAFA